MYRVHYKINVHDSDATIYRSAFPPAGINSGGVCLLRPDSVGSEQWERQDVVPREVCFKICKTARWRVCSNADTLSNFACGLGRSLRKSTRYLEKPSRMVACQKHKPKDGTRRLRRARSRSPTSLVLDAQHRPGPMTT